MNDQGTLIYTGKTGNRRVNGRKMEKDITEITDPREVADLTGKAWGSSGVHPDFKVKDPPKATKPKATKPKAYKPEADKEES